MKYPPLGRCAIITCMINHRLFENYRIDTNKNLKIKNRCPRPYDTLLIDKQGSCYACECTSWLPQSIGNLQIKSLDEIIGSDMRQHLQSSITDGTYRYCNEHQCSYLKSNTVLDSRPQHIKHLRLAFDESCNLRCPSCRTGLIFHKEGKEFARRKLLADKVNTWLHTCEQDVQVHIGSDGDPFASHVYRHFMENTPVKDNIKYSMLTNGLMFKEFHLKVPHVINNLTKLGISIDGASKETYEKLRIGGRWEKILEGLECIAELKTKHDFQFDLHMVVQQDNWHELEEMLKLGRRYGVDRIYFNKIEDWNTNIDFNLQTFVELDEFKISMKQVGADPIAWNNVTTST